jgi:hypothetical protein
MIEYVVLALVAAVVLLMLVLRTNTAISFLALCAGSVLLMSSGTNSALIASSLTSGLDSSANAVRIVLLCVPLVVCMIMLRGHLKKSQLPFAFLPAVATALLAVIFVSPELSDSTEVALTNTTTWSLLLQYQEAVVVVGLVSSLILLLVTSKKPEDRLHKGKHRR